MAFSFLAFFCQASSWRMGADIFLSLKAMDYLASHPWVVAAGVVAIGVGVWWWMSRKEKFGLGRRIKAIVTRRKPDVEISAPSSWSQPKISGPYDVRGRVGGGRWEEATNYAPWTGHLLFG